MTDESNGESTFEFVEKKTEECSISGESVKHGTPVSSSASLLSSLGISTNAGSILTSISPPMALPSFVTDSVSTLKFATNLTNSEKKTELQDASVISSEPLPSTSTKTDVTKTEPPPQKAADITQFQEPTSPTSILFSWVKENVVYSNVLSKVAEKAKNSVNSMITTLDPQMKEFIYSGGDVEIVVASDKEVKISPVREAFQNVFGKATVIGVDVNSSTLPIQPIGIETGVKAAEQRISLARNLPSIPHDVPIVAIENFLLEVSKDKWYDLGVIIINDPKNNVNLQTFTQMTPVPSQIVTNALKDSLATPTDLSVTIGSLMAQNLQVHHSQWCNTLTGVSRRDIIYLTALSLVGIYKNTVNLTQ